VRREIHCDVTITRGLVIVPLSREEDKVIDVDGGLARQQPHQGHPAIGDRLRPSQTSTASMFDRRQIALPRGGWLTPGRKGSGMEAADEEGSHMVSTPPLKERQSPRAACAAAIAPHTPESSPRPGGTTKRSISSFKRGDSM
jgi:hypothetical protein